MSALYIFFIPNDPHGVKLLFKLLPMWLIIAYAYLQFPADHRKRYDWLLLLGLFFCMLGDGLLDYFIVGLSAFLIGHLFYMAAFFHQWQFSKLRFATIIPIAIYAVFMSTQLVPALRDKENIALIIPVLIYLIIISLMCWSAIMSGHKWATIGSILFVISDSILSWNMFVSDVPYSGVLIMVTYYSAQFLMAYSIRRAAPRAR